MRFSLSQKTKFKLAGLALYSPFFRLLIFKFWFRMAFLGLLALLVFLALFLPQIWTVSDPGSTPVVKVSGVDLLQAWNLKRSSRRQMSAGEFDRAHFTWLAAIGDNPTDRTALRGLLGNLTTNTVTDPEALHAGLAESGWLLRLSHTNRTDLDLVAQFYQRYEEFDLLAALLLPLAGRLNPAQQAACLKALYSQGALRTFAKQWNQFRGETLPDPELPIYWAAYQAGWGSGEASESGRATLNRATEDPRTRVLALRLALEASLQRKDEPACRTALQRLSELGKDRLVDHASYWELLAELGRPDEAKRLASESARVPQTPAELAALAKVHLRLGLEDSARQLHETFANKFPKSKEVWISRAAVLTGLKDWLGLSGLAVGLRTEASAPQDLLAYSYFLDGVAQAHMGRTQSAEAALTRMNQLWESESELALEASRTLLELGFARQALDLLGRVEPELSGDINYWHAVFAAANRAKHSALLLKAARHEYELDPASSVVTSHYATALLINRQQPALAASLTSNLASLAPDSVVARIYHGAALVSDGRLEEAQPVLAGVNQAGLSAEEKTALHLARFDLHYQLRQFDRAWEAIDQIDRKLLFPTEAAWLSECQKQMPSRSQAKL